jgi:hypothetical protein
MPVIYIVVPHGTIVLGAYTNEAAATRHSQCITGTGIAWADLVDRVPVEIEQDLYVEWDGENDTPVHDVDDVTKTVNIRPPTKGPK